MIANLSPAASWFLHLVAGGSLLLALAVGVPAVGVPAQRSPAWRHWLLTLAFAGNLALLPLSLVLPLYELEISDRSPLAAPAGISGSVEQEVPRATAENRNAAGPVSSESPLSGLGWLVYGLGVLWVAGGIVFEALDLRRLTKRAVPFSGDVPLGRAFLSHEIQVPLSWGWRRPVVLLPAAARGWGEDELRWVLVHEATHLRRRDPLVNLLAQLVCALQWFNPLVWWSARRLRFESEAATDDRVLSSGVDAARYADLLLRFAGELVLQRRVLAAGMADRSGLARRLAAILKRRPGHEPRRAAVGTIALAALVLVAALASLRVVAISPAEGSAFRAESAARLRAAWTLGDRESRAGVAELEETLADPDPELRAMAAWALGEIKDPAALEPLVAALDDEDFYVREMVILALGEHEHPAAIPALVEQLTGRPAGLRAAAVTALAEIDHRRALMSILGALEDADASVRRRAAEVLGERRFQDALPALLERLDDPSPAVRESAATALGHVRSRGAVVALADALSDAEPAVRAAAARALGEIGDDRAVERLIPVLRDAEPAVRAAAIWALDEVHGE